MKSVFCDQTIQQHFDDCERDKVKFETGLLLGQSDDSRVYVMGVVPTPALEEDDVKTHLNDKHPHTHEIPSSERPDDNHQQTSIESRY